MGVFDFGDFLALIGFVGGCFCLTGFYLTGVTGFYLTGVAAFYFIGVTAFYFTGVFAF